MSRVGKKPIITPAGVTVKVAGQDVSVKGPKGELSFRVPDDIAVAESADGLTVSPRSDTLRVKAMWGMSRAILANKPQRPYFRVKYTIGIS